MASCSVPPRDCRRWSASRRMSGLSWRRGAGEGRDWRSELDCHVKEEHSWSDPSVKHNSTHVFYCDWPLHGSVFYGMKLKW